jgi:hypothetical protein
VKTLDIKERMRLCAGGLDRRIERLIEFSAEDPVDPASSPSTLLDSGSPKP